jgi:hypothetical protein
MRHKPTEAHERPFSFYASVGMSDDDWQSFLGTLGGGDPAAGQKRLEGYAALRDCLKQAASRFPRVRWRSA